MTSVNIRCLIKRVDLPGSELTVHQTYRRKLTFLSCPSVVVQFFVSMQNYSKAKPDKEIISNSKSKGISPTGGGKV